MSFLQDTLDRIYGRKSSQKKIDSAPISPDKPVMSPAPVMTPMKEEVPMSVDPAMKKPIIPEKVTNYSVIPGITKLAGINKEVQPMTQIPVITKFDRDIAQHYMEKTNQSIDDAGIVKLKNALVEKGLIGFNDRDIDLAKFLIDKTYDTGIDPMAGIPKDIKAQPEGAYQREVVARKGYKESGIQNVLDQGRKALQIQISDTFKGYLTKGEYTTRDVDNLKNTAVDTMKYMVDNKLNPIKGLKPSEYFPKGTWESIGNLFEKGIDALKLQEGLGKVNKKIAGLLQGEEQFSNEILNRKRLELPEQYKGQITGIDDPRLKDPEFVFGILSETIGQALPGMAVAMATRSPYGMIAVEGPASYYRLRKDLIENGATEEQADKISTIAGPIIGGVEVVGNIFQLNKIPFFKKIMGETLEKGVAKSIYKIAKDSGKNFAQIVGSENIEELTQNAIQNSLVKIFNDKRSILGSRDDIKDVLIRTTIGSLGMGSISIASNVYEDVKNYTPEQGQKDIETFIQYLKERQPGLSMAVVDMDGNRVTPENRKQYQETLDKIRKGELASPREYDRIETEIKDEIATKQGQETTIQDDANSLVKTLIGAGIQDYQYSPIEIKQSFNKLPKPKNKREAKIREDQLELALFYGSRLQDKESQPEDYVGDVNESIKRALKDPNLIQEAQRRSFIREEIETFYNEGLLPTNPKAQTIIDNFEDRGVSGDPTGQIQTKDIKAIKEKAMKMYDEKEQQPDQLEEILKEPKQEGIKKVYHGTREVFDKFSLEKAGMNTERDNAKFGIFFSDDKEAITEFLETTRQPGDKRPNIIKETSIKMDNPLDLTIQGLFTKEKQAPLILKILGYDDVLSPKEALKLINEEIGLGEIGELQEAIYTDIDNKKLMQEAGYDGIISQFGKKEGGEVIKEYVVFDESQIIYKDKQPKQEESLKEPVKKEIIKLYRADKGGFDIKKGQQSGYYPGVHFYTDKDMTKHFGDNVTEIEANSSEFYNITDSDILKKEAEDAGYKTMYGNGNAEVQYLKDKGYKGMIRGKEYILFDIPKKLIEQPKQEESLKIKHFDNLEDARKYGKEPRYKIIGNEEKGYDVYDKRYDDLNDKGDKELLQKEYIRDTEKQFNDNYGKWRSFEDFDAKKEALNNIPESIQKESIVELKKELGLKDGENEITVYRLTEGPINNYTSFTINKDINIPGKDRKLTTIKTKINNVIFFDYKGGEGEIFLKTIPVEPTIIEQPKQEPKPDPNKVNQATEMLIGFYKKEVTKDITKRLSKKFKDDTVKKAIKKIAQSVAYQPTLKDYKEIYQDPRIINEARSFANERGMLDKAENEIIDEIVSNIVKVTNEKNNMRNIPGYLTYKMKLVFNKRQKYRIPIKGKLEDIKIKTKSIATFLKTNVTSTLHLIETPTSKITKPFSMMGTKEKTFGTLMSRGIYRAVKRNGAEVYNEPFSGVGTTLRFLPSLFGFGLKKANLNFFDIEKFTIINAIKTGKLKKDQIRERVLNAHNTIIGQMTEFIKQDPEMALILEEAKNAEVRDEVGFMLDGERITEDVLVKEKGQDIKLGTKLFQQTLEFIGFYPELAKEFFKQTIDSKLAVRGDISETFKNRLREKKIKPKLTGLEGKDLEIAIDEKLDEILSKPQLFEAKYASISKKVTEIIDKYDNDKYLSSIDGDIDKAMLVAMARHFRQRGTSGQRMISPSDGFKDISIAWIKMVDGLTSYAKVFEEHGDKISVNNMDGKEFIGKYSKEDGLNKQVRYLDPPYIRTTNVYMGNNPDLNKALQDYADPKKFNNIIEPIKDANSMMLTNDIDGDYFQTVKNVLGDKMSNNIYGYKEGETPTSFITTTNIDFGSPSNMGLSYFTIINNAKITNAIDFKLEELPEVAKGLKKNIAKFLQYASRESLKVSEQLTKIQQGIEIGTMRLQELQNIIQEITTGREKLAILSEAKKLARSGKIGGDPLIKITNMVNSYMEKRGKLISKLKDLRKKIDSGSINAEVKSILKETMDEYNFNRAIDKDLELKELYDKGNVEAVIELEEMKTSDPERFIKIMSSDKKSIYGLTNDHLEELIESIQKTMEMGRDMVKYYNQQEEQLIEKEIEKYSKKANTINYTKDGKLSLEEFKEGAVKGIYGEKRKKLFQFAGDVHFENIPSEWMAMATNTEQLKRDYIDDPFAEYNGQNLRLQNKYREGKETLEEKYGKYDPRDMQKITFYGLSKRDYGKGIPALMRLIKEETGIEDKDKIRAVIEDIQAGDYLSEKQMDMYELMQDIYNETYAMFQPVLLQSENRIVLKDENYRPLRQDYTRDYIPKEDSDKSISETLMDIRKRGAIEKSFTKKITGSDTIPLTNAEQLLLNHIDETAYYSAMEIPLRRIGKIKEGIKEKLGQVGYKRLDNYIYRMKVKGKTYRYSGKIEKGIEQFVHNIIRGMLGFRVMTVLLQFTDIVRAIPHVGNVLSEGLYMYDKQSREILSTSNEIKYRDPRDPIFTKENTYLAKLGTFGKKIDSKSMIGVRVVDKYSGSMVFIKAYKLSLAKQGTTYQTATDEQKHTARQYADSMVRKVLADPTFKGATEYVANHKGVRSMITPLLTFVSNQYGMVSTIYQRIQIARKGLETTTSAEAKTEKEIQKRTIEAYIQSAEILVAIIVATAMEERLRDRYRKMVKGKNYDRDMREIILGNLMSFNPVLYPLSQVMQGDTIVRSTIRDITTGIKSESTINNPAKFTEKVVLNVAKLFGVPGMLQLQELIPDKTRMERELPKGLNKIFKKKKKYNYSDL